MPALALADTEPVLAPQVLFEFWVVATRPAANNGLDWTVTRTRDAIARLRGEFRVLQEPPEVLRTVARYRDAFRGKGQKVP
jgi:hypothetical protein